MGGYPLRAPIGVAAAVVLCLVGAFGTYDSLVTQSRELPDEFKIAAQHQRFAAMAAFFFFFFSARSPKVRLRRRISARRLSLRSARRRRSAGA